MRRHWRGGLLRYHHRRVNQARRQARWKAPVCPVPLLLQAIPRSPAVSQAVPSRELLLAWSWVLPRWRLLYGSSYVCEGGKESSQAAVLVESNHWDQTTGECGASFEKEKRMAIQGNILLQN